MTGIKVLGTGSYVPVQTVDNEAFAALVDTSDEWIRTRTGMQLRHISDGEQNWFMGTAAARQALATAGIAPTEIGLILDSTVTPDFYTPSTACLIQRELGAVHSMAIDINAACTGFVCAFDMAARYLATNPELQYVLVVATERLSRLVDYTDRSTCVLFGDGAAACVLTRSACPTCYASFLQADGTGGKFLYARMPEVQHPFHSGAGTQPDDIPETEPNFLRQDGRSVYRFATEAMPKAVLEAAERAGIVPADLDWIVPHQANLRILETAAKKLDLPMDKFIVNLQTHGNTSSASIPLAFDEALRSGKITRGNLVCLTGFGAGLTYGAVIFTY